MKHSKFPKVGEPTPPNVADLISDIIKNKVVCDIGCGEGDFMQDMAKYAKKIIGIEFDKEKAKKAFSKGFEIMSGDSFFHKLPEADVYYAWTRDAQGVYMKAKWEGTKGIFIFGLTRRPPLRKFIKELNPEVRIVNNFEVYITNL